MQSYTVYFCIANRTILNDPNEENKVEIPSNNVEIRDSFKYTDYTSRATIDIIKTTFFSFSTSLRYECCKCLMKLYYKISPTFGQNRYHILSRNENDRVLNFNHFDLYLIKIKSRCDCEYKDFYPYMSMHKWDVITKLKLKSELYNQYLMKTNELELEKKNLNLENEKLTNELTKLKKEMEKLKKEEELKYLKNPSPEKFYDIIIEINSIKKVNKEGWKVKFNDEGLERYQKYRNKELIAIGVIGNVQKGKSFLLNKISKIKFLTGTSIHTQGLSVKYPEIKENQERKIIFLDTAGLENPILRRNDIDIENNNEEEEDKEDNKLNENKIKEEEEEINQIEENNQNDNEQSIDQQEEIKLDNDESENIKAFKENSKDKLMTESFIENFIINVSDILLVVIGELTYSEQLLINKIKDECKKQNKGRIFIIHNLKEFRTVKQVEKYINEILLNCSTFDLKKRNLISNKKEQEKIEIENNKGEIKNINIEINKKDKIKNINIEKNINDDIINPNKNIQIKINEIENLENKNEIKLDNNSEEINNEINIIKEENSDLKKIYLSETLKYSDKKIEIYHLILANEDSDAGKAFNQNAYDFIENAYNLISEPKKFDIFDQVKINFKSLSNIFLNNKLDEVPFNDTKNIIKDKKIKLNLKDRILFKKCQVDELGVSLFKTGNFEPKYNYFKPDQNTLEIRLEVPGNTKCDVKYRLEGQYTIINIKGEKKKDKLPESIEENIVNKRDFSKFDLDINLNAKDFQIQKLKEKYPMFKNGVCIIQYELSSQIDQKTAEPDDEI